MEGASMIEGWDRDWGNNNKNMNLVTYCSECAATSWNSCICLRSIDPEDEENVTMDIGQGDGNGMAKVFHAVSDKESETAVTKQSSVQSSNAKKSGSSFRGSAAALTQGATDDPEGIAECLQKMHAELDAIRQDKEAMKQNLAESCLTFLHELKDFKKKTIAHIEKLETNANAELNSLYEKLDQAVKEDLDISEITIEELKEISEMLESDQATRISMDIIESKLADAREVIKDISKSNNNCKFKFVFNPTLHSVSSTIKSLGRFVFEEQTEVCKEVQEMSDCVDVNVRHSSDKRSCCISGICQVEEGPTLLADRDNRNLKCFDTNYKITDCYELNAAPRGVCSIENRKAAVALSNNTVQYVDVGSGIVAAGSLSLEHECWGIASHRDKLYISDWMATVYIYSLDGNPVATVYKDQYGRKIFTNSRHIAVSENCSHVYVTDRAKGLVVMDEMGRVHSELSHPDLKLPHGVCTDKHGNIFMSGSLSQNIVMYSQSETKGLTDSKGDNSSRKGQNQNSRGDRMRTIVKSGGVSFPGAMCFDNKHSRLLVTSLPPFGGCDTMRVFTLHSS